MHNISEPIAQWLVSWRYPLLLAGIVIAVCAYFPSSKLDFDRSIENMFAPDDPLLPPYRRLAKDFGGNEIVLLAYRDDDFIRFDENGQVVPDDGGLERVQRVSQLAKEVPGVRDALSLMELSKALDAVSLKDPPTVVVNPTCNMGQNYRKLFEGFTHSDDYNTVAVVCMLQPESEAKTPRRTTIDSLRSIAEKLPVVFFFEKHTFCQINSFGLFISAIEFTIAVAENEPQGRIAGEPVMVVDGFRFVEEDGHRLGWSTTILLAVVIILCFRSLRWVIIPIAVVQFAILATEAVLVVSGLELSMVSSMLAAIVTVVGVATVVHVIVRFRDARSRGLEPREALTSAAALLIVPVFWACTTDAVGFASLLAAKVGPVQDFGVMMAVGALMVLVSVALLVPGLALLGRFDTDPQRAWGEDILDARLRGLMRWIQHSPRLISLLVAIVVATTVVGVGFVEVETDFTKNFVDDEDDPTDIVSTYEFVESKLGGAGVWDITLPAPSYINDEYLDLVQQLEERLRAIEFNGTPGLTKVISVADADAAANVSFPLNLMGADGRLRGMEDQLPTFMDALLNREENRLRIMLRARERQPAQQKLQLIAEVRSIVDEELAKPEWKACLEAGGDKHDEISGEVTGFFVLLTNLIKSMIRDQWVCFGIASLGIAVMMLVAFRSPVLALVALVPNALPILMVLGMMGWLALLGFGVKINMGAAMIAAVSMGLSVDSSIHYITSFRRARKAGKSVAESLSEVQQTVGRAVVFSTLALIVGFAVLCTSNFVPTIYFGLLVSLAMLGGLFGNLLVLPLLLKLVTPEREKSSPAAEARKRNEFRSTRNNPG